MGPTLSHDDVTSPSIINAFSYYWNPITLTSNLLNEINNTEKKKMNLYVFKFYSSCIINTFYIQNLAYFCVIY